MTRGERRISRTARQLTERVGQPGASAAMASGVLMLLVACAWILARPAEDLLPDLDAADPAALRFVQRIRGERLTTAMKVVTHLGNYRVLVPVVVLAGLVWYAARRDWYPFVLLMAAYGGAVLLSSVLKIAVGRARPSAAVALGHFGGLAFPSGHATQATAVWGAVAFLVAAQCQRPIVKVATWTAAATVAVLVGASRAYLGAHWLTDVMGGWTRCDVAGDARAGGSHRPAGQHGVATRLRIRRGLGNHT